MDRDLFDDSLGELAAIKTGGPRYAYAITVTFELLFLPRGPNPGFSTQAAGHYNRYNRYLHP